jgi:predicted HTH domain antitoxin
MSETVAARLPEAVVRDIDYVAREEKTDKSKVIRDLLSEAVKGRLLDLALEKYSKRLVSLGKAAELARLPLADFLAIAAQRKIPLNYSIASLEKDFEAALKAK